MEYLTAGHEKLAELNQMNDYYTISLQRGFSAFPGADGIIEL